VIRNFADASERVAFDGGFVDLVTATSVALGREVLEPGWRWSTHMRPSVGTERCEFHHVTLVLEGRIGYESRDGDLAEAGPGDVADVAPGHDSWVIGDVPAVLIMVQGALGWAKPPEPGDRFLTTLLFTDIVGSTETAERLGDRAWTQLLQSHDGAVRGLLERFRGRVAGTTGDGIVATFDAPAQAVRCALAIASASSGLGVQDRIGVHTGEVEMAHHELRGVAVHLAARIMAAAGPGEVFVSATVTELASGAGIDFEDRGSYELKGFAGARELFQARGS